jgi:hypothetical protein
MRKQCGDIRNLHKAVKTLWQNLELEKVNTKQIKCRKFPCVFDNSLLVKSGKSLRVAIDPSKVILRIISDRLDKLSSNTNITLNQSFD